MRAGWGSRLLGAYVTLLFIFLGAPMVIVVFFSLNKEKYIHFPPSGLTLSWFGVVLQGCHRGAYLLPVCDQGFMGAAVNSLKLAAVATFLSLLLGIPAALALRRYRFPGRKVLESYFLSPLSLPLIVLGVALLFFFGRMGLGLTVWGLVMAHVVITIPYILRTVLSVYRGLDISLEESAMVLGANGWRTFWHVTLPLIRPGIIAGCVFSYLISFDNLPVSIFLTRPDTTTLPVSILTYLVYNFDPSVAAISTMEMIAVIVVLLVVDRFYGLRNLTAFGGQ